MRPKPGLSIKQTRNRGPRAIVGVRMLHKDLEVFDFSRVRFQQLHNIATGMVWMTCSTKAARGSNENLKPLMAQNLKLKGLKSENMNGLTREYLNIFMAQILLALNVRILMA